MPDPKKTISSNLTRLTTAELSLCQKLSLPGSWGRSANWSGQRHICQTSLGLGYLSAMMILQQLLTWDDYVLSIGGRSSKMAKEGAARKHLIARSWKLVRNADVNISSSISTAVYSVEYLNPFNNDSCAVVNGDPGCSFSVCVADSTVGQCGHWRCISVNTVACSICSFWINICWWLGGSHRLQLNNRSCKCNAR